MTEITAQTTSLCPYCLRRIPALRITENDSVYLRKRCPEHGDLEDVLLWKNVPIPYESWARPHMDAQADLPLQSRNGCPFDCGLCSVHKQETCAAILEVTHRCNLHCPVCFASSQMDAAAD